MIDFPTYQALARLYADYAATLDAGDWAQWPEFFVDDCVYRIVPRENYDNGLPLATLAFESKAMLQDRVYAISETIFHDPYYQRHVVAAPRVLAADADQLECEASYAVFRTKPSQPTTVFNVGRYIDVIRRTPQGLKFASRQCVFDSELIANSLIYPL
ncbi:MULTISPECIES: aromatic-ring-hydroxylating dioxygenase subunit beta [Bordetella]|uniref:Salicylate hydroxylase n=2 Tax=Bordetella TaxID=517 RepID=A0A261VQ36_9BORD|nr:MULTISPECIES: aromatic-ring-hydroxylating dioxygenase subunit beta [Bordetella]MDM9559243.1 aromatic-ring-hydroxylating dioxygenase subunit beta [Bordetella petrii]OZI76205.1 salicylate hydroxylase [Bordetella genomosp. 2]